MRAKVTDYPSGPVVAFGGYEYVKYEWRDIPPGFEAEAGAHPLLEVEKVAPPPSKPKATPKPKATRTRTRRKTAPKGTSK